MSLDRFKRTIIKLDKANNRIPQIMLGKEGDYYGRELEVHLLDDGERVDTTGVDLNFQWKNLKSGEFGALPFEEEDAAKGTYVVAYPPEMLTKGDASCAVQIIEGGSTTHTMNFNASVEGNPLDSEVLMEDNSFKALGEALTRVNSIEQRFDDVIANATVDSEVILARDGFSTLGARLDSEKEDYASLFTSNADAKNSIYRGKYLGSSVTAAQYTSISSGTFTDLYIGDYWTIGGINWRIAAFNYYRNTGDALLPGNHITIVPDTQLYAHVMNDTHITTGGYTGSKMYTVGLEQAKTIIRGIFGTHLVKHRQLHSNATVGGKANGWAWVDSEVDLMNEIMVYGSTAWGESTIGGSGYNIGVGKSQLPLFALNPRMINTRQSYWLRDVVSASHFAFVYAYGYASYSGAGRAPGVRPAFSIS